jgi:hypothetical protein
VARSGTETRLGLLIIIYIEELKEEEEILISLFERDEIQEVTFAI